ncbi:pyridoxamine 5'-phosphate oxidase family protein [Aquihabitans sp. McL0605]|uniref:pyridoxamine 5'-phosphate oxidase family protein n=1 Tax=Aquihabitans sp. McL0605 TaxID=3415671 RepID=UPI003CEB4975
MDTDTSRHTGLEHLSEHDCFVLMGSTHFGRIGVTVNALPAILPVHFALLGRDPVFRTDAGAKLMAASAGQVLCLEVDHFDAEAHSGWSVSITGTAHVLTEPVDLERATTLPLRPWVGHGDAYVRIDATIVSGRHVGGHLPPGAR